MIYMRGAAIGRGGMAHGNFFPSLAPSAIFHYLETQRSMSRIGRTPDWPRIRKELAVDRSVIGESVRPLARSLAAYYYDKSDPLSAYIRTSSSSMRQKLVRLRSAYDVDDLSEKNTPSFLPSLLLFLLTGRLTAAGSPALQ